MDDLIRALAIFSQYLPNTNALNPTNCSHDVLAIMDVEPCSVSDEHTAELGGLGFFFSVELDAFISYRFGSA